MKYTAVEQFIQKTFAFLYLTWMLWSFFWYTQCSCSHAMFRRTWFLYICIVTNFNLFLPIFFVTEYLGYLLFSFPLSYNAFGIVFWYLRLLWIVTECIQLYDRSLISRGWGLSFFNSILSWSVRCFVTIDTFAFVTDKDCLKGSKVFILLWRNTPMK